MTTKMNKDEFLIELSNNHDKIVVMYKKITKNSIVDMDIIQDFYLHAYDKMKVFNDGKFNAGYVYIALSNFICDKHRYNSSSKRMKTMDIPDSSKYYNNEKDIVDEDMRQVKEDNFSIIDKVLPDFTNDEVELVKLLLCSRLLASVKGTYDGEVDEDKKTWALYMRQYNKAKRILRLMKEKAKQIKR
jgi:hypothetical protein